MRGGWLRFCLVQKCGGFRFGITLEKPVPVAQVARLYTIQTFSSMKALSYWTPAVQPWKGFSLIACVSHG